ncbi:MAG: hypothetical protein GY722_08475 [bacterium]|nr:hypothetical protein [bacterium]
MTTPDRFHRPDQPLLFDPPRILPTWTALPLDVQQAVARLLFKMLRDHLAQRVDAQQNGAADE